MTFFTSSPKRTRTTSLKRSLSLPLLLFYGLGNIIGAGVYVLVGEVAGLAGYYAPISFLVASAVAGFTALSYTELSARLPLSAGEAVYIHEAFGFRWLTLAVGLLIAMVGIVSAAVLARGFVGYFEVFFSWPEWVVIAGLLFLLGAVATWGINQSVLLASLITILEIGGLLVVIWLGRGDLQELELSQFVSHWRMDTSMGIMLGAFIAFYAFVGFEDIVNVAEEVRRPQRTIPLALILALLIAAVLYLAIAFTAISVVSPDRLAASRAPLALIVTTTSGHSPLFISAIGLLAVVNGALVQIIMSARVLYGMSRKGWLPAFLGAVHPVTQTPIAATAMTVAAVTTLALYIPLLTLASVTSFMLLVVFSLINLALLRIQRSMPSQSDVKVVPRWIPITGFVTCAILAFSRLAFTG